MQGSDLHVYGLNMCVAAGVRTNRRAGIRGNVDAELLLANGTSPFHLSWQLFQ